MAKDDVDVIARAGKGDDGTTGLLGGERIAKDDVRIEAYGTVDEASSAVGLAKALSEHQEVREICEEIQRGLYKVAAELATMPGRENRYVEVTVEDLERLDELGAEIKAKTPIPGEFILPGSVPASGAIDLARAIARRAERRVVSLGGHEETRRWLNRVSLVLFVLGRYEELLSGVIAEPAKD